MTKFFRSLWGSAELSVFVARLTAVVLGPAVALAIANNLSPEVQGFYFSFTSIIAAQSLFEAGLSVVIIQLIAHERASGSHKKIGSIFSFFVRWFRFAAILMGLIIGVAGAISFSRASSTTPVDWGLPWLILVVVTIAEFSMLPYLLFFEGVGAVNKVYRFRTFKSILYSTLLIGCFFIGANLYSISIAALLSLGATFIFIRTNRTDFPSKIHSDETVSSIQWKKDILPFQWKVACSWMAGYFTVSIFTPVLLWLRGPVDAGKMGLTISMLGSCTVVAAAIMQANASKLGSLYAAGKIVEFIDVFKRRAALSVLLAGAAIGALVIAVLTLNQLQWELASRFVDPSILVMLGVGYLCYHFEGVLAFFSRAQKIEPYFLLEMVAGALILASTLYFGKEYGQIGIAAGFLAVRACLTAPIAFLIYLRSKSNLIAKV